MPPVPAVNTTEPVVVVKIGVPLMPIWPLPAPVRVTLPAVIPPVALWEMLPGV